ncbi:MAG: PIN domain-containing protein [Desulfurivibrionaceae bacterium]
MILLDTNVLSELMRVAPEPRVLAWLDQRPATDFWVSAITVAEIGLGIALLPDGRRRAALASLAAQMFQEDFAGRCLPFDQEAARLYAEVVASCTRLGRPISVEDAQIAAIALANRLTLATRNTRDFEEVSGLALFDPWRAG